MINIIWQAAKGKDANYGSWKEYNKNKWLLVLREHLYFFKVIIDSFTKPL